MKNTKKSKILSLVLCGAMILSTFAFLPARADAADEKQAAEATRQVTDSTEPSDSAADTQSDSGTGSDQITDSDADSGETTQSAVKTVDFTNAAPLLDPVVGKSSTAKSLKKSAKLMTAKLADFVSAVKTAAAANGSEGSERVDNDGIVTSKTATKNADGTYKIRLESYVTGSTTSSTVTETIPTDIVLVLDQSSSMRETFGSGTTTKLEALKDAATSFADAVAAKATEGGKTVDHRIAVVSYGDKAYNKTNGFKDMTTADGKTAVMNAIKNLGTTTGTMIDDGISTANKIFASNPIPDGTKRNRVVIVFTDGAPGKPGDWDRSSANTANNAITNAKTSQNTYNATVYSIGIFKGADASTPDQLPAYTQPAKNLSETAKTKNSNRFLHLISSNYPDAGNMETPGTINPDLKGKSYYLSASNAEALKNIFEEISKQIDEGGADVKLDSSTVVKDIVSDYFELPEGTDASKITLKTADFDGYESDGKTAKWKTEVDASGVTASISDKTLNVTGFDFSENYVGIDKKDKTETARGKKLIIEFNVKARDGFLGGNGVPTNGADSGIYTKKDGKDTVMENFEQPTVDVPISEITAAASDKNVYLDGSLDASAIKSGITVKAGNIDLTLAETNYGLESWQNAFVDINVSAKDKAGNDIFADGYEGMKNLTADNSYTVEASINVKSGSGGNTASANGNVNVFKPELTYKDSIVYYGDTAPESYDGNKVGDTVWKHGNTTDTDEGVEMTGTKPELTISYNPAIGDTTYYKDGQISTRQDIPVKATVKIGDKDVTGHVTFKHNNCDPACGFDKDKEQFLIHVKTCSLTVEKTGGVSGEPYVMNIYKDGAETPYTSLTIVGNAEKTVKELPVGKYTVKEDTKWAWRYSGTDPEITPANGISLSKDKTSDKITVKNQNRYGSFLNGYSTVVKNTFSESN